MAPRAWAVKGFSKTKRPFLKTKRPFRKTKRPFFHVYAAPGYMPDIFGKNGVWRYV
jgi:hypothetical protein